MLSKAKLPDLCDSFFVSAWLGFSPQLVTKLYVYTHTHTLLCIYTIMYIYYYIYIYINIYICIHMSGGMINVKKK